MQDDKSNNNDGKDTGQEVSIVTFYLSNITLLLLAEFISVVVARGVDGICTAAARELVVAASSKILKIFPPLSIQVSLPMY